MEALLAAIAKAVPDLIATHGLLFVLLLMSVAGNVVQYREALREIRRLNELVNAEIKNGTSLAERLADKFTTAAEAYRDAIAAKRGR